MCLIEILLPLLDKDGNPKGADLGLWRLRTPESDSRKPSNAAGRAHAAPDEKFRAAGVSRRQWIRLRANPRRTARARPATGDVCGPYCRG